MRRRNFLKYIGLGATTLAGIRSLPKPDNTMIPVVGSGPIKGMVIRPLVGGSYVRGNTFDITKPIVWTREDMG